MTVLLAKYALFFLVGVVQDVIITAYYQSVAKGQAWNSGILSATVTFVNLVVLYGILSDLDNEVIGIILVYTLGCGVGTFIVVKWDTKKGSRRGTSEKVTPPGLEPGPTA